MTFYTIGHSNRTTDELVLLLESSSVVVVADVRTTPRSRANPQFESATLADALADRGIGYEHIASLGGRRPRQREVDDDVNGLWQNRSFHNYADHALGESFAAGLARLRELGRHQACAVMCSEAVWWRCHRRIIADHLLHHREEVYHIVGPGNVQPATLTPGARVDDGGRLVYPNPDAAPPDPAA